MTKLSVKQHIYKILWMAAMLSLLLICSACGQQGERPLEPSGTPAGAEGTLCYFVDMHGQPIYSWYSEEDAVWYLFVPGSEDLSSLTLHVDDAVTETSAGVLDPETDTIADAFAQNQELILMRDGTAVRIIAMQSDLPSLHIVLEDVGLDEVHADKQVKFAENSIYVSDPAGVYEFAAENCVELKGRGNSSWSNYEKKGYQLKFNEQTSLMGMAKAKKWVLLANASDDSMMRNQLAYQAAKQLGAAFVPSYEYIDLWVNGEYRGTYMLGEKVEVDSERLNLTDPLGGLYEHDENFYSEDANWFMSEYLGRHFVQKDAVIDNDASITHAAVVEFQTAVDQLAEYLYSTPSAEITLDDLSRRMDVDSFAQYYLINEFLLNRESFATSFYWHKDGPNDVLHLGPIWDFDTCMGNDGAGYGDHYGDEHILFKYLLAAPAFRQRVLQLQEAYWPQLIGMTGQIDALYEEIRTSAELNYLRWSVLGKANPKGGKDFSPTFEAAAANLKTWLENRAEHFAVPETKTVTASVNHNCSEMDLYYTSDEPYTGVRFAVWNMDAGQDNLLWYAAEQDRAGGWSATADLSAHNRAGLYRIDVYPDGSPAAVATGCSYVEYATGTDVRIEVTPGEDGETLDLAVRTPNWCRWLRAAVWSAEGEQDDLVWYDLDRTKGKQWRTTVNLKDHSGAGTYCIHLFSPKGLLATQNTYVARGDGSVTVFADLEGDGENLHLTLEGAPEMLAEVRFAVWRARGGQDDLMWYPAEYSGNVWTAEVPLRNHGGAGKFIIHAYNGIDENQTLLGAVEPYIEPLSQSEPQLRIEPDETGGALIITLTDADQYDRIWFPVWSVESNQADIVWHEGVWSSEGEWSCTAAISGPAHYIVQAYAGEDSPTNLLADAMTDIIG